MNHGSRVSPDPSSKDLDPVSEVRFGYDERWSDSNSRVPRRQIAHASFKAVLDYAVPNLRWRTSILPVAHLDADHESETSHISEPGFLVSNIADVVHDPVSFR